MFLFSFSAYATQQIETLFFNVSQQQFRIGDETTGDLLNTEFPEYVGKWEYNNATNTLTLTNFVWETSAATALQIVGSCTLYVKGTNTFTSTFSGGFSGGIFTENASLTISGDKNGILNVTGGNTTGNTSHSFGIYAFGGSNATVSIIISGGTVNVTGGNTTGNMSNSYGIWARGGSNATVSITISGGTVNATGGTVGSGGSYGIEASSFGSCNIAISGRTVVAKGHMRAIQNSGTLTLLTFPASRYNWTANTDYNNAEASRRTGTKPRTPYTYSTGDRYIEIALIPPVPKTLRGNIIVYGGGSLIIGK